MDLAALRAALRTTAARIETRLSAAIDAGRELTADEEAQNTADEAEVADLSAQIAAAEAAAGPPPADAIVTARTEAAAEATTAERTRILALVDLCPSSVISTPLRTAIDGGQDTGAFAIGLAQEAKTRGASVEDLARGAVQTSQLPAGAGKPDAKPQVGAARGASIVARAAALGHSAVKHLHKG